MPTVSKPVSRLSRAALAAGIALASAMPSALPAVAATGAVPGTAAPFALPSRPAEAAPRIHVAQNRESAELMVRIQDLEQQIRTMTGQIEGLQFQLTQMQTLVQRMQEDNEFRFQQLEGGAGGKPQAAAPTDGAMPSDTLPQDQTMSADTLGTDVPMDGAPMDGMPMEDLSAPMDFSLGESSDPLVGTNSQGAGELGTLSGDDALSLEDGRPLDLSLGSGDVSDGDAEAQYAAGYDAMTRGDYAFAEEQFTQFVALYPDNPRTPDAINWLGEALIQRGAYTDAAQVLADGYTRFRDSRRAPDMMLKLGVALAGAEQIEVACRTFSTLKDRYSDLSPAFVQRLDAEAQKAQCPVG